MIHEGMFREFTFEIVSIGCLIKIEMKKVMPFLHIHMGSLIANTKVTLNKDLIDCQKKFE